MKFKRSTEPDSDEQATPQWMFKILHDEFKFNLDVCASRKNHKRPEYLTEKHDGLKHGWGKVNFCNPPYSNILPWYTKAIEERDQNGATTVFVTKYDPSTKHGVLAAAEMDEIRIVSHRIKFNGADNCANFPSAVMVCKPRLYTKKTQANIFYVNYKDLSV